jgi:arginyl-tRNA synthetase
MNTFTELEALGIRNPATISDRIQELRTQNQVDVTTIIKSVVEQVAKEIKGALTKEDLEKLEEYTEIFYDLQERQPELFNGLLEECRKSFGGIKLEAGKLNLAYEKNEPEAVSIMRKMVIADLSGMQQTLDIYGIQHNNFDFESELGWEGSNQVILDYYKNSPFFVPQTQCNAKGEPQGAYLDLEKFIVQCGLRPKGKKGYQPNYPPLYILRPDGSTLYTFRDIVYSLKKTTQADMVLNVIAAEQNLAQEKVCLGMHLLQPQKPMNQYHVSYELVKLENDRGEEVKMSGRRGRYVLADTLHQQLKDEVHRRMVAKFHEKGKPEDPALFDTVVHQVATAAMKYALVSFSCRSKIRFNVNRVCDFEDSSAPFLLYNATRFFSLFRNYENGVKEGLYPPLPPPEKINWHLLTEEYEWSLLLDYVLGFPTLVHSIGCPNIPHPPELPEWNIHLLCDFLISLVRSFSKYWAGTHVLIKKPTVSSILS